MMVVVEYWPATATTTAGESTGVGETKTMMYATNERDVSAEQVTDVLDMLPRGAVIRDIRITDDDPEVSDDD